MAQAKLNTIKENDIPKVLKSFLVYLTNIKGKSKRTRQEYKYDLMLFLKYMKYIKYDIDTEDINSISIKDIDNEFIKNITLEDLYSYMEYCEEVRENGVNTRARKVVSIKSFFKYLFSKKKILTENVAVELEIPKKSKRNPIYLNLEEAIDLQNTVKVNHNIHSLRDFAIITIFLNCGIRVSELVNININDISNNILSVIGKGNKERIIYLNKTTISAINDYLKNERVEYKNENEPLFISQKKSRISARTVQRIIKKYVGLSNINNKHITPHKLRHTCATLLYGEGIDIRKIQTILGHENISTTEIYTHVKSVDLEDAINNNPLNKI